MVNALVVMPQGAPLGALQSAINAVDPSIAPKIVLEGVGGVVDANPVLVQALDALPSVVAAAIGPIGGAAVLGIPQDAQPWVAAWNRLFDPAYVNMLAARPASWFTNAAICSIGGPGPVPMTLTGDIAVGVVLVSGPAGSATELSLAERTDICLAVIHGMDTLYRNAPGTASLVFLSELKSVTLGPAVAPPAGPVVNPTTADYESREGPWRDAALQAMGFPAGFGGVNSYRNALLARPWPAGQPQNSIVAFFTKYPAARAPAYAAAGRLVYQLDYARAYPGPAHFDRVFAHETCHLFEALDEYANQYESCDWSATRGPFNVINGNCVKNPLATMGFVPCLMNGDSDDLCGWSKAQLGWAPFP
jgi:hypothetical protein